MVAYSYLVTLSLGCRDVSRRTRILLAAVFTDFESHHRRCTYGNTRAALIFTEMFLGVGALDKDVSWVSPRHKMGYCMQSACSVRLGKARTAAAISTTSSVYYLRPRTKPDTQWSVIRRATKKSNMCTVNRAQFGPIPTTKARSNFSSILC